MALSRKTGPEEWLQLIAKYADSLKDARVSKLKIGDAEFEFHPSLVFEGDQGGEVTPEIEDPDPLNDPSTYHGRMPTFRRPEVRSGGF